MCISASASADAPVGSRGLDEFPRSSPALNGEDLHLRNHTNRTFDTWQLSEPPLLRGPLSLPYFSNCGYQVPNLRSSCRSRGGDISISAHRHRHRPRFPHSPCLINLYHCHHGTEQSQWGVGHIPARPGADKCAFVAREEGNCR